MHFSMSRSLDRNALSAAAAAALLMAADLVLPRDLAHLGIMACLAAVMIGTCGAGALRRRSGRTLHPVVSPNVAALLRRHAQDDRVTDAESEISIVCADIRNFTRFSAATGSADVMRFLREYYDAVGTAVTEYGGTIKDYAGDGILVLVGAPRPLVDHADRAVNMALAIRAAACQVTARWSHTDLPLGIGVGVASGAVTVGMVGSAERLEYAAVGPAVNLASRLCGTARMSEILVDDRSRELARSPRAKAMFQAPGTRALKGFDAPVHSYAI